MPVVNSDFDAEVGGRKQVGGGNEGSSMGSRVVDSWSRRGGQSMDHCHFQAVSTSSDGIKKGGEKVEIGR
jgi:hypothetical protein